MNESGKLSPVAIQGIERMLAKGADVPESLLATYSTQTGRPIPAIISAPNAAPAPEPKSPTPSRPRRVVGALPADGAFRGFLMLQRGPATERLLADRNALHLLLVIGYRARWSDVATGDGLSFGQAFLGDHASYDLTRKEYRAAASRLEKWGLATFRGTPLGTIATLADSRVIALRDVRTGSKTGHQEGQPQGHLFPEEKRENEANLGATSGAGLGPSEGQVGATNEEGEDRENGKESNTGGQQKPPRSVFVPPSPEEVTTYSASIDYPLDGHAWCDSYAQKGWMVGRTKMKDWKAAVRNWKTNGWKPNGRTNAGAGRGLSPEFNKW